MTAFDSYNRIASVKTPREEEATAFRLAARRLREAGDGRARNNALRINHELWSLMLRDLGGSNNRLPPILKNDCITLARFSLDYSTRAVLRAALPLDPLISINEQVADGLNTQLASVAVAATGMPMRATA